MKKIFITTAALLIACTLSAADLFVSPEGNDRNPGTKDSPKATLTAALRQARELRRLNDESVKGGITIHLEAGDYHLYEPVFIRPDKRLFVQGMWQTLKRCTASSTTTPKTKYCGYLPLL